VLFQAAETAHGRAQTIKALDNGQTKGMGGLGYRKREGHLEMRQEEGQAGRGARVTSWDTNWLCDIGKVSNISELPFP
jgi:hypothetical protein